MIDSKKCCGCEACINICPKKAITMQENEKGFFTAVIEEERCIHCDLCDNVCPLHNINKSDEEQKVYAAINCDKSIVEKSSSGGVFFELAKAVIEGGGYVSGVTFDDSFTAVHTLENTIDGLKGYFGSKYVQSQNGVHKEIKNILNNGGTVLYSGTPCQVAGIKNFTKNIHNGCLLTVEVLCHGVGSPRLFRENLATLGAPLENINFRCKKREEPTIEYSFHDNTLLIDFNLDAYANGFNRCIFLNEVCFNCPYASASRAGDITIGDFWKGPTSEEILGKNASFPKGVSLVLINSKRGEKLWDSIKDKLFIKEATFEQAAKGNRTLTAPSKKNKYYDAFWDCYKKFGYKISSKIFGPNILYRTVFKIRKGK